MGYCEIELKLPTDFQQSDLKREIGKELRLNNLSFFILRKSLDARNKRNIHWLIRAGVESDELKSGIKPVEETLTLPDKNFGKGKKTVVTGCGPAGIFAAIIMQEAGFQTTLIEKGKPVKDRTDDLINFERTAILPQNSGYSFGEGGAGTFSDGKLTSRTKAITKEKNFIFKELIEAGAPSEIAYMTHPHLGSDNLKKIVPSLIKRFLSIGGTVLFETEVTSFNYKNGRISSIDVSGRNSGQIDGDIFIFAPGHSSFDFYRLLLSNGVRFENKPFAIGFRVEHLAREINLSQWGTEKLPGVKAAEYRLNAKCGENSVFTFCMCPGGKIVQASPKLGISVVNGMSDWQRDGKYSNSAVVTPFRVEDITKNIVPPIKSLDILEDMERSFFDFTSSYDIPAMKISDIINRKTGSVPLESSYSFKLKSADLSELFPEETFSRLREGLKIFTRKISCFENGVAAGLESKTSAPVKAVRTENHSTPPFENLYICGEGSGHAGGIISSAADGIKVAIASMKKL